jgi:hypothetical protein
MGEFQTNHIRRLRQHIHKHQSYTNAGHSYQEKSVAYFTYVFVGLTTEKDTLTLKEMA